MLSDDEARVQLAARPFPDNPWVRVTDEAIVIRAGYNEAMQRMLRWVPQARWRRDLRCWWVPLGGVELVRSVLPELSRLAEAMQEEAGTLLAARQAPSKASTRAQAPDAALAAASHGVTGLNEDTARHEFREAARLLYGADWQRETARALNRDEAALACWIVGEGVAEAPADQLLNEILALMRRRADDIRRAADALASRLGAPSSV